MLQAWDSDGHVEEWEGTFGDAYLDPAFRDRRPAVIDPRGDGFFYWQIPGRSEPFKFGGSPTSRGGVPSLEQSRLATWRGHIDTAEFRTAKARLDLMDAENLALQVNYPTMFLKWPVAPDPALNAALSRSYNNWMADISGQAPDRMKWVTVLDFSDPKAAAKEVERSKGMGSIGIMLFGLAGDDKYLDDPSMEPVWAAAAETGLAVAVHPGIASGQYGSDQFHFSVLTGFKKVVLSGVLDRYPKLKVGFLETGCAWVEFMLWRVEEEVDMVVERREMGIGVNAKLPEASPEEYIKAGRLFFGFEVEDHMLPYVVDRYGPDAWLFASDIPHAHRILDATGYLMAREDLSLETKRKLLVDNTARFYDLPLPG